MLKQLSDFSSLLYSTQYRLHKLHCTAWTSHRRDIPCLWDINSSSAYWLHSCRGLLCLSDRGC